jgi:hypothetical protein
LICYIKGSIHHILRENHMKKHLFRVTFGIGFLISFSHTASAQWVHANEPFKVVSLSGTANAVAASGSNIFVGTNSGVWLSTNNGTSWTAVNSGLTNDTVNFLTVSGNNIFAGTKRGVFLSNNNGTSWTAVNSGLTNINIACLEASGSNIFAGTSMGVFHSTNNGTSWTRAITDTTVAMSAMMGIVYSLAISGSNIFAGTGGGVFLSTNNGTNWTPVNSGLTNTAVYSLTISSSNIIAGSNSGVFLSNNNGTNWSAANSGLTDFIVEVLAVSGANIFAGTKGGVFLSNNNAANWNAVNFGLNSDTVLSLAVGGTGAIIAGTNNGVYLSNNNGTSWIAQDIKDSSRISIFTCLAANGSNIFAGNKSGIFLSTNKGTNWTTVISGLTDTIVTCLAVSGGNIFAGTNSGIFLSTNNGTNWTVANSGLIVYPKKIINSLTVSGSTIYAGTSFGGLYSSSNNGTSWTAKGPGTGIAADVAVSGSTIVMWFEPATINGNGSVTIEVNKAGVYLSPNSGTSWNLFENGLVAGSSIYCVTECGRNIFAGTSSGVSILPNNGTGWTSVSIDSITSFAVSGSNIFAGTIDSGVVLSDSSGLVWVGVNSGFNTHTPTINALAVNSSYIFAAVDSGIWCRLLSEMIGATRNKQRTLSHKSTGLNLKALNQSSHNVAISFFLAQSQRVTLKIYNLFGREIAMLVNRTLEAGKQKISWNTKDMAEGCYAVRIQAGSNIFVKNILVSR